MIVLMDMAQDAPEFVQTGTDYGTPKSTISKGDAFSALSEVKAGKPEAYTTPKPSHNHTNAGGRAGGVLL